MVVPRQLAENIRNLGVLSTVNRFTIIASIRARGDSLVGSVVSDSFHYPIDICDGCLMVDQGVCPVQAASGNNCFVGQDTSTGCCTQMGQLFCPSLVASK
jgi:hypothetical protein